MVMNSAISWTHHTFNPWWGCVKISPACTNCYAATFDHRLGGEHWGPKSERKFFGEKHWREPLKWNASAAKRGVRERVFCASMADVFEDRDDLQAQRVRLWKLIEDTPQLDWLLLTKRPENIRRMLPVIDIGGHEMPRFDNVWLGTTVENQKYADERINHLLSAPAVVHFLSMEPLLGPVSIEPWLDRQCMETGTDLPSVTWVIAGCESGHGARASDTDWYRALRDQCAASRVPFFLKQAKAPSEAADVVELTVYRKKDGDVVMPSLWAGAGSKEKAGGVVELPYLDGVQHDAFPVVSP